MRARVLVGAGFTLAFAFVSGCGSDASPSSPSSGEAPSGAAGSGGGSAGKSAGGAAGSIAGTAGGAGASGGATAGKGGTSSGGTGGTSASGAGGTSAGGSSGGGTSAGAGGSGACDAAKCAASVPATTPAGCAHGVCDVATNQCIYVAVDADGDGHATQKCKPVDPSATIVLGDDCDDADVTYHPGAWDGPKGDGHPDSCDGLDEDCDGVPDQGHLADGTSCTCTPNDVQNCSTDSSGKPIKWPTGMPIGECKYGSQTCLANGTWGPCTDAIPPSTETCNGLDDDCDGMIDDDAVDEQYWVYDGDDDLHGALGCDKVLACKDTPPNQLPTNCAVPPSCAKCTPTAWKLGVAVPVDDCDDNDASIHPGATELCDAQNVDSNCNGTPSEGCTCQNDAVEACWTGASGLVFQEDGHPDTICHRGVHTCSGGQWGDCTGETPQGTETCNGKDDDCDGQIDQPFGVGSACDVLGKGAGVCRQSGTKVCAADNSSTVCQSPDPAYGKDPTTPPLQPATGLPPGGATGAEWDWNCDGTVTLDSAGFMFIGNSQGCFDFAGWCNLWGPSCTLNGTNKFVVSDCYVADSELAVCGKTVAYFTCLQSGSGCTPGAVSKNPVGCH